jgi:hypothetical protein
MRWLFLVMLFFTACGPTISHVAVTGSQAPTALSIVEGLASWYGPGFAGRRTASGEIFDPAQLTAAHRNLPFGTFVRVTNLNNNLSVTVRINDRGPFKPDRIIDLSRAAAEEIRMISSGTARVRLEVVRGAANGAVPIAIDRSLSYYSVVSNSYREGQLLLLSSSLHETPLMVRVVGNGLPEGLGVEMLVSPDIQELLGEEVVVVNP